MKDHAVNLNLHPLPLVKQYTTEVFAKNTKWSSENHWLSCCIPIISSFYRNKFFFLVVKESSNFPNLKKGMVVEHSQLFSNAFIVSHNVLELLESLAVNLKEGNWEFKKGQIIRFPSTVGCGDHTTRDIHVKASPLFISERSSLGAEPSFLFAYRIRMEMDPHSTFIPSQLQTRHWFITDGTGQTDEVSGPGVVGFYPQMRPGAFFEYASCCPLRTPQGSMRGSFQMRGAESTFDVVVPDFTFQANRIVA